MYITLWTRAHIWNERTCSCLETVRFSSCSTHRHAHILTSDRENCTVFVDNLPKSTEESDLRSLFKDVCRDPAISWRSTKYSAQCGAIRELKLTHLPNAIVAAVEFTDRVRCSLFEYRLCPIISRNLFRVPSPKTRSGYKTRKLVFIWPGNPLSTSPISRRVQTMPRSGSCSAQ
jgi:hypothetical protein